MFLNKSILNYNNYYQPPLRNKYPKASQGVTIQLANYHLQQLVCCERIDL